MLCLLVEFTGCDCWLLRCWTFGYGIVILATFLCVLVDWYLTFNFYEYSLCFGLVGCYYFVCFINCAQWTFVDYLFASLDCLLRFGLVVCDSEYLFNST